jgi:hypothetical protein
MEGIIHALNYYAVFAMVLSAFGILHKAGHHLLVAATHNKPFGVTTNAPDAPKRIGFIESISRFFAYPTS